MSNRRRLLGCAASGGGGSIIEDGLLFWCDGLNNLQGGGYSTNTDRWYAYKTSNSFFDGFYLQKIGTTIRTANGYTLPSRSNEGEGAYWTTKNIFNPISGDYTLIIAVSNVEPKKGGVNTKESILWGGASPDNYNEIWQKRYGLDFVHSSGLCSFQKPEATTYFSGISTPTLIQKGIISYRKDGSSDILDYDVDGTHLIRTITARVRRTISGLCFVLGGYAGAPGYNADNSPNGSNWCACPGTYHACILYNRKLSDSELAEVSNILKNRYGLN